jgi:hypothetical protein
MNPSQIATDPEIRDLAREILARDAYAQWRSERMGRPPDFLLHLLGWLQDFLAWTNHLWLTKPLLYAALVGGLLLLAAVLLVHVVYSLRAALSAQRPPSPKRPDSRGPRFLEEAEALARAGRFLEAAHRLELAVIDLLLRKRVLELSRSDPNRILRRRLREASLPGSARQEVIALIDRFEVRWFRDRSEDRDLYDAWRGLFDRLRGLSEPS